MLYSIFLWILDNFKYGFLFMCGYLALIALGNLIPRRQIPHVPPQARFAIVIPAHNEEMVIADLIQNLGELDYPRELFHIYVICDHCTDQTAAVVEERGALALRRDSGERRGKGAALEWGLEQIFRLRGKDYYDAFCFFDADNRVSRNFLAVMNNHLAAGHNLMQAFLDLKNPNSNWITRTIFVEQRSTNFLWHTGKTRWGLGNYLIGTGMCVRGKLLAEVGWKVQSLTEDLELSLKMALRGERIRWVPETKTFDEAPTDLRTIWFQRQRWSIGGWRCFFRFFLPCLWQGLVQRNLRLWDMAIYLITPAWLIFALIYGILNAINTLFSIVQLPPNPFMTIFGIVYALLYVPSGIFFSGIPVLRNIPYIFIYMILIPVLGMMECLFGLIRVGKRSWFHTPHKAKLDEEIKL